MQVIKAVVIGMGVLIFLGLGLLIYGFSTQLGNLSEDSAFKALAEIPANQAILSTKVDEGRLIIETLNETDGNVRTSVYVPTVERRRILKHQHAYLAHRFLQQPSPCMRTQSRH